MQGKGIIKVLLVLLIFVSLLQTAYIFPTRKVEKDAALFAAERVTDLPDGIEKTATARSLVSGYLDSMSSETIFRIPLLADFSYDDLKKRNLALGLDLKGGQSVVLQVDMRDLMLELSNGSKDPTFLEALDKAELALQSSQSDFVTLFASEFQKIAEDKKLSKIFLRNPILREKINAQSSDGEVVPGT